MPVYFFDRIENGEVSRGEHGMEFATLQDARRDALRALTEIARDELPEHSEGCELIIYIRQDDGPPIPQRLIIRAREYGKRASRKREYARYRDDSELMLNHAVNLGLVEVHPPRLEAIKRVLPLQSRN